MHVYVEGGGGTNEGINTCVCVAEGEGLRTKEMCVCGVGSNEIILVCVVGTKKLIHVCLCVGRCERGRGSGAKELIHVCLCVGV